MPATGRPLNSSAVSMLKRAGGVVLGKTVTTEFAHRQPAKTKNPRNLAHSPGGSSSGSAAAVAAGMVPIAIGTQTGGSVIRPAAFCGVAGFKPSYRLLPTVGVKCFSWSLDTVGLFAAQVVDVAYAAAAMSGRDLRVDRTPPRTPALLVARTRVWHEASPDMQRAIEDTARAAQAAGARVEDIDLPDVVEEAWRLQPIIMDYEAFRALAYEYDNHRNAIGPMLGLLLRRRGRRRTRRPGLRWGGPRAGWPTGRPRRPRPRRGGPCPDEATPPSTRTPPALTAAAAAERLMSASRATMRSRRSPASAAGTASAIIGPGRRARRRRAARRRHHRRQRRRRPAARRPAPGAWC